MVRAKHIMHSDPFRWGHGTALVVLITPPSMPMLRKYHENTTKIQCHFHAPTRSWVYSVPQHHAGLGARSHRDGESQEHAGCLVNSIFMGRGALWEHASSVANYRKQES